MFKNVALFQQERNYFIANWLDGTVKAVDKELEGYQAKLKEVDLNKTRLEREIDSLPADAKYRERKLHDMTLRLDSL